MDRCDLQSSTAAGESKESKVSKLAADVLSKVPKPIDYENTDKLTGVNKTPLDVVLLQEIQRLETGCVCAFRTLYLPNCFASYNSLLTLMNSSLQDLQKGIKGLVVMSSELEEIFTCMFEGRVPSAWLKGELTSSVPLFLLQ